MGLKLKNQTVKLFEISELVCCFCRCKPVFLIRRHQVKGGGGGEGGFTVVTGGGRGGGGGGGGEVLQFSLGVGKEILRPLSVGAIPHLSATVCEKSAS